MHFHIQQLSNNLEEFKLIFDNWNHELIYWKKDKDHWCALEVVSHLLDEEKEDFRSRMQTMMESPSQKFKSIDPVNWVLDRDYIQKDYKEQCQLFYKERNKSINYLKGLSQDDPSWFNEREHESLGRLSPLFFLENWVAHDLLHLRQLTRIKYDYMSQNALNAINYAGNWK